MGLQASRITAQRPPNLDRVLTVGECLGFILMACEGLQMAPDAGQMMAGLTWAAIHAPAMAARKTLKRNFERVEEFYDRWRRGLPPPTTA